MILQEYEIKASIHAALNTFLLYMGWQHESFQIQSIQEDIHNDPEYAATRKVNVSIKSFSFDFLAIVRSFHECSLYMDTRTSLMVVNMKLYELRDEIEKQFRDHLSAYPHNIGM